MRIVVDANIIISMLIKPGIPTDLLFVGELEAFAPEFLLEELKEKKEVIIAKSGLTENDIEVLLEILKKRIIFVAEEEFDNKFEEATRTCPDPKDTAYFALALYLNCPIWTNDKKLREQKKVEIYPTHELLRLFNPQ